MKRHIVWLIIVLFALGITVGCGGGDGFFDGNRTCAISVKSINGVVSHGQTWDYVMVGQLVYRECWIDDGKHSCFRNYTHSPREMYRN